jgi:hypothetical protein
MTGAIVIRLDSGSGFHLARFVFRVYWARVFIHAEIVPNPAEKKAHVLFDDQTSTFKRIAFETLCPVPLNA